MMIDKKLWDAYCAIEKERDALRTELDALKAWKEDAERQEPRSYLYRYTDPISGHEVWRSSPREWNGQIPGACMPLYTRPIPPAPIVPDDVMRDAVRYRWLRLPASSVPISGLAARDSDVYDAEIDKAMIRDAQKREGQK